MRRKESRYPADWVRFAVRDFARAEQLLSFKDPEAAGFFLQQGLEKAFKGFLLARGWKLKRIHDLETLLNESLKFNPDLEAFRILCRKIAGFYIIERYPFLPEASLQMADVESALAEGKRLYQILSAGTDSDLESPGAENKLL